MAEHDVDEALVAAAREAARHAHAPYSGFAVGAAVRLADGGIVTGANVENASYGLSLCAETVALATASAQGRLADVTGLAVCGGRRGDDGRLSGTLPVMPCGRCRQIINEAAQWGGRNIVIDCAAADADGAVVRQSITALLPHAFGPADLGAGRAGRETE